MDAFFDGDHEFLQFMFLHSVFSTKPEKDRDWLEVYMIKKLQLPDEEIDKLLHPDPLPEDISKLFAVFNPAPIGFEIAPIRFEYGMWQRIEKKHDDDGDEDLIEGIAPKKKKKIIIILDPIHTVYTSWEYDVITQKDVRKAIAEFETIDCETGFPISPINDDLPF